VEISGGMIGENKDIALAKVFYENPFTQRKETSAGRATARFSKDRKEVRKSANIEVFRDYQLNLNALAQEKAITLSDKGKKKEAVEELRTSANQMRELGEEYDDDRLLDQAQEMEAQAAQIEKEGMTKKSRKMLRTDSFQMKNQQMRE
jgi:Ca-activated chloride channel family protein